MTAQLGLNFTANKVTRTQATKMARRLFAQGMSNNEVATALYDAGYASRVTRQPLTASGAFKVAYYNKSRVSTRVKKAKAVGNKVDVAHKVQKIAPTTNLNYNLATQLANDPVAGVRWGLIYKLLSGVAVTNADRNTLVQLLCK